MVFWSLWWNSRAEKVVSWIFENQTYGFLTLISWVFMILERFYGKNIRCIDKTWDIQQLLIQPAGFISFTLLYSNHCLLYFDSQFMLTVYYVRLQWIWTSAKCIFGRQAWVDFLAAWTRRIRQFVINRSCSFIWVDSLIKQDSVATIKEMLS